MATANNNDRQLLNDVRWPLECLEQYSLCVTNTTLQQNCDRAVSAIVC